ncbi:MAG TPA: AI-2E family transporter YdiK [Gammaproteobacteria bacterium]|nr:AI-2E family transporter YdiK [Gammaproteobacteria bacterium]
MQASGQTDLTRTILSILIILALIVGSAWTLLPFLSGLTWATTIVVATWPLLLRIERLLGGSRAAATALMTVVVLAIFVVPFGLAVTTLLEGAIDGAELVRTATREGFPEPPSWLGSIPLVGAHLTARWQELTAGGPEALTEALRPFLRSTASWAVAVTGGITLVSVHFLVTLILAVILYSHGETTARGMIMFARRLGGDRGERAVRLAGQSLRGVALGVVVTALVQSMIAGVGLWLAGIPRPGLLLAMLFLLCVAQLGPLPVLVPAIAWLFWTGNAGWGIALIVVAVIVAVADNVLKPMLIRRGVDLPLLLIVSGVVGGIIGFGVVGLFMGPVLLAVTFTLLDAWVRDDAAPRVGAASAPAAASGALPANAPAAPH